MAQPIFRTLELVCVCLLGLVTLTAAERSVTGIFRGNSNDALLAFATAHAEEPFSGKETVIVILTERDTGVNSILKSWPPLASSAASLL